MSSLNRLIRITIGLIVVAAIAVFVFMDKSPYFTVPEPALTSTPPTTSKQFSERGVVVRGNPGQKSNQYYLVYEKPGSPALTTELAFDGESMCVIGGKSINCLLLSSTLNNFDRPILIEGTREGDTVTVETFAVLDEQRNFGFIKSLRPNDQNYLIEIDPVEFLSGDTAVTAAVADSDCAKDVVADCVPSLNNDFYIRNTDKKTETYTIASTAKIQIFKNPGSPELVVVPLAVFVEEFKSEASHMNAFTFKYVLEGTSIVSLEEQYTP